MAAAAPVGGAERPADPAGTGRPVLDAAGVCDCRVPPRHPPAAGGVDRGKEGGRDMYDEKVIARNLRELLEERRMSQRELADLIGAAAPNVSYWCNGVTVPTIYKLIDICNAMKVPMDRLLKRRESDNDEA